ncbi:MAG: hypothetical protein Q9159_006918 [Coniocarpon cinnabarinum]
MTSLCIPFEASTGLERLKAATTTPVLPQKARHTIRVAGYQHVEDRWPAERQNSETRYVPCWALSLMHEIPWTRRECTQSNYTPAQAESALLSPHLLETDCLEVQASPKPRRPQERSGKQASSFAMVFNMVKFGDDEVSIGYVKTGRGSLFETPPATCLKRVCTKTSDAYAPDACRASTPNPVPVKPSRNG